MFRCKFKLTRNTVLIALVIATSACSNFDAKRFAPPGIIKYEDIAGDQPTGPEIQAIIDAQVSSTDDRFPLISDTPDQGDVPKAEGQTVIDGSVNELAAAGTALREAAQSDRDAAASEREEIEQLEQRAEAFREDIEREGAAAKSERLDSLEAPAF